MALYWFLAGTLTTLALMVLALPWLRNLPRLSVWQASICAAVLIAATLGLYAWLGQAGVPTTAAASPGAGTFGAAAKIFAGATVATGAPGATGVTGATAPSDIITGAVDNTTSSAAKPAAGSMEVAIASLEERLAKGGGSADDWELLAKSFEFLGRPADAAKARAKQLPASAATSAATATPAAGTAVTGQVTLAANLLSKAVAGETLFIIAKSVDSPGIPVAVIRGSVGSWPVHFTLDDSQSMMPGKNLSSAGRVTIEARISRKGQPLPSAGDLQGSSGIIDPADHKPLVITIDHVIT